MARINIIDRFIDVADEPNRTLLPIEGYEKKALLPLKEAVASIETPIHNLAKMVWTAERNSKNPSDGLTTDESASIHLYTMESSDEYPSFYKLFNEKLRSERRNELKSWYSYMKLFMTALYKLPSVRKSVWRGVRGNLSHLYEKDYIWWGVSSCTETMKVMEKFIGCSGLRTIFMIECINGKEVKSHSLYQDENEILLMPGTYLHVVSKWDAGHGLNMIHLQEKTPPHQFVAQPFYSSSSSIDTSTTKKQTNTRAISTNNSTVSTESHKTKTTHVLPSKPQYKNPKLEQKINANKDKSELWFNDSNLTDNDMEIVAYYLLQNNETLITLHLHGNQIGDKGAQYLGQRLQNNTTLSELYLHNNQIADEGVQYISEALSYNTTLTVLSLAENQIELEGAKYLYEALKKNTTLTTLHLSANQLGVQGTRYLCEALLKNKILSILDLSANQIGTQGAEYFSELLKRNKTLSTLVLDNNQIGDQGAQYLGERLQENKTLRELHLHQNQIGNNGAQYLERLKRTNKQLKVLW